MNEPRHVNDILQTVMPDLFERSKSQARADSVMAMKREMPKLCAMLDLNPKTLKPNKVEPRALQTRLEIMRKVGL